jgi:hypothetical protein
VSDDAEQANARPHPNVSYRLYDQLIYEFDAERMRLPEVIPSHRI